MAKHEAPTEILAAGAVVLRDAPDGREVLVVHRPRYDDWTLPKGKLDEGELLPVCAVREVGEETGVQIRIGTPLGLRTYPIGKQTKVVHWWVGVPTEEVSREADDEVDDVAWWPLAKAAEHLTYEDEREVLAQALDERQGGTLLLIRHAKAVPRKRFRGKHDSRRGLTTRGKRQARELSDLLAAYGVDELASSSWTRCMETLAPYSKTTGIPTRQIDLLTEASAKNRSRAVQLYLARLRSRAAQRPSHPLAVCGHRPVLPDMFEGLSLPNRPLEVADCVVLHLAEDASPNAVEVFSSTV